MKKSTNKAFSPSNSLFISIQFHRLGVLSGTTCTRGCKHIASSCFYRGLWYFGLTGLFNGRSGHGFKPHPIKYHWFKSPITFKIGISSNDRAGLKYVNGHNTGALPQSDPFGIGAKEHSPGQREPANSARGLTAHYK